MDRFKKIIGIAMLCLLIPFTLAAETGADNQEVDAFSFVNTSSLGWKIGHFSYWEDAHARIHRPFNQMTRIECGWNYYLMSLVDPIYDEAKAELEKVERMTTKSPDLSLRVLSFNQQKGTFEFNLNLSTTGINIDLAVSVPYQNVTGDPWPSPQNYMEYNTASSRARNLISEFQSNPDSLLADMHYVLSYIPSTRRYTATVKDLKIYMTDNRNIIYETASPIMRSFVANPSKSEYYRGDILFNEKALDKRVAAIHPQKFGLSANPFGLSYSYKELNDIFSKAAVRDRNLEIEELHEKEENQVRQLEESMKAELLQDYELKYKVYEVNQAKEDKLQAKYDAEFEKKSQKILKKTPIKEIVWVDNRVSKRHGYSGIKVSAGAGLPLGSINEVPLRKDMLFYGGVQLCSSVCIDLYGSGGYDMTSSSIIPEDNGSDDIIPAPEVQGTMEASPVWTGYAGLGPSFSLGIFKFIPTGGLAFGMVSEKNAGSSFFMDPAAKISLKMVFNMIGIDTEILIHGKAIEALIGMSFCL